MPDNYYNQFYVGKYASFSIINSKNISHYGEGGNLLFAYNFSPSLISHIFPIDSDSDTTALLEDELTEFPSLWLTLSSLDDITFDLKTYNQITAMTKDAISCTV